MRPKTTFDDSNMDAMQFDFSRGSASEYRNPDGRQGIALHFDVANKSYTSRLGVQGLAFDGGGSGHIPNGDGCLNFDQLRRMENMSQTRQLYFRYMCTKLFSASRASAPSLSLDVVPSPVFLSHETGHMLGLGHGGHEDLNAKPNYFSLMNYLFNRGWNYGQSQLRDAQFSHGAYPALRPHELCERDGLQGGSLLHLDAGTSRPHKLMIDEAQGWVDWNLDGIFSTCTNPVRAAITFTDTDKPVYPFTEGGQFISGFVPRGGTNWALTQAPLAGVEHLLMFYTSNGQPSQIHFKSAPFDGSCTGDAFQGNGCLDWSALHQNTGLEGRDASATRLIESNGDTSVYLAFVNDQDELLIARRTFDGSGSSFTYESYGPAVGIAGRPDIMAHGGRVHVVWRTSGNDLMGMSKTSGSSWSVPTRLLNLSGNPWTTGISPTLATAPSSVGLHLLRTTSNTTLDVLRYDASNDKWVDGIAAYDIPDGLHQTSWEAQMVWFQDFANSPDGPGHWQILYRNASSYWRVATLGTMQERSAWWNGPNERAPLELFYMPSHDNVVAVMGEFLSGSGLYVRFLPFADGVIQDDIADNNDFESMSEGICFGYKEALTGDSRPCGRLNSSSALTSPDYYTGVCDGL